MTASMKADGQEVAQRAYEMWRSAGEPGGRDLEYWLRAERELRVTRTRHEHVSQPRTTRPSGLVSAGSTSKNIEWGPW